MTRSAFALLVLLNPSLRFANADYGHGLRGVGITIYGDNLCAAVCRTCLDTSTLKCSTLASSDGHAATSARCYSTDNSFQTSLAYCISTYCHIPSLGQLEDYWQMSLTGDSDNEKLNVPSMTYAEALKSIAVPPTVEAKNNTLLNETSLVAENTYQAYYDAMSLTQEYEFRNGRLA